MRISRITTFGAMMASTALAGCQAAPTFGLLNRGEEPAAPDVVSEPPAAFTAAVAAAPPRGDWILAFRDPVLTGLVEEAVGANFDVAAASARLAQATASARIAGASRLPTLDGSLGGARRETVVENPDPDVIATESFDLTLSASWEADLWGRLRDQARAGVLDAQAAQADLADARLSIAGAVAQGWFNAIEARLQRELAEDALATQERSLELTTRRFESGVSGALDVRLARSAAATSEAALAQSRNLEADASRSLEVLLGRYPSAELAAAADLPALPGLDGVGVPGELLARRPDLRAAEARLTASGLRADQARKAMLPRLSITAAGGTASDDFSEIFDPDYLISSVAGSLLQPVFRGGALSGEARRTRAVAEEALALYANQVLTAYTEVEGALDAEVALALQEDAFARAAEEAVAAEALAERNYTRGLGTIFELLDAQRARIQAQSDLISVRQGRVANRVSLYLALGGDTFAVDPSPAAQETAL